MSGDNGEPEMYAGDNWNPVYPHTDVDEYDEDRAMNNQEDPWASAHVSVDNGSELFDTRHSSMPEDFNRASEAIYSLVNIPNVTPHIMQSPPNEQRGQYCRSYRSSQQGVGEYDCPDEAPSWNIRHQQTYLTNNTTPVQYAPGPLSGYTQWSQMGLTTAEQRSVLNANQTGSLQTLPDNTLYRIRDYPEVFSAYATESIPRGSSSYTGVAYPQASGEMGGRHYSSNTPSASFDLNSQNFATPSLSSYDNFIEPILPMSHDRGPWSPENPRQDEYLETTGPGHLAGVSDTPKSTLYGTDSRSSVPEDDLETSATTMSSELENIINMTGSCDTLRPGRASSRRESLSINQFGSSHAQAQSNPAVQGLSRSGARFLVRVREGTPVISQGPEDDPVLP